MRFALRNSVIRNPKGKIKYRRFKPNGYEHYHVGLWVEAPNSDDLDQVTHVVYTLHPTFRNRVRRSSDRMNNFSVTFWSWGAFAVSAELFFSDSDQPISISGELTFELPESDSEYVDVSDKGL